MKLRARLTGLAATLALLAILAGVPAALLAVGANPIPHTLPTLIQIREALTTPDDGTLAMGAIVLVAWAAWAAFAASILLEITARLCGLRAPRLRGLHAPQAAALHLVTTAALLFIALPATTATTAASPATAATRATVAAAALAHAPAAVVDAAATAAPVQQHPARTYVVRRGDTLSGIAARELGNPNLWPAIADLNPAVAAHPDLIYAGTRLHLPDPTTQAGPHSYTVRAGDTLTGIAARELGNPDRYMEIFTASRHTIQPGGARLTDPDLIDVGWRLTVPGTADRSTPVATKPSADSRSAPQTTPTPQRSVGGPVPAPPGHLDPGPVPAPTATASPVPAGASGNVRGAETGQDAAQPAWMLAGLTGSGSLLAGSMLLLLRRRRRAQIRHRRPGHTLPAPDPVLTPVEKTLNTVGAATAPTVDHLDAVLRRLAAAAARDHHPMPELAAVQLTATTLVLHLATPAAPPHPWTGPPDGRHWTLQTGTPLDEVGPDLLDQPAPYPLLVTIGVSDNEDVWLLNLEDDTVTITGDPTYGADLARHLTADLACTPWAAGVRITCVGVAAELATLNPDRIDTHPASDAAQPAGDLLATAVQTIDRAADTTGDVTTARAHQAGDDAWPARLLLIDATIEHPILDQLIDLIHTHPGHTGTAVLLTGDRPVLDGRTIHVTDNGRLTLPDVGLDLVGVGLTSDEAQGCAALIAHTETTTPTPIPVDQDATDGWRAYSDQAGALRAEHTQPRHPTGDQPDTEDEQGSSLLEEADDTYTAVAATTPEDLQALAPHVRDTLRHDLDTADPTLDADLAMWLRDDSALPKLHLLGPVHATTRGKPLVNRKAYMTELLTYLALHPHGVTPAEVAEAFNLTKPKVRGYILTIRDWLGTNPRTHTSHLPDARHAPATTTRGVPVYQVMDLLIDIDIFRRLRLRGQARGADGIDDLIAALALVKGRPFNYPTEREAVGGWAWLLEGDRIDQHLTAAVVDVAHTITTHALAHNDPTTARWAAETATRAAPYEDTPRLDLLAIADAEGDRDLAVRIARDQIANRTDDELPPCELPQRTTEILQGRRDRFGTRAS